MPTASQHRLLTVEEEVLMVIIVFNGKRVPAFPLKCPPAHPSRDEKAYIRIFFSSLSPTPLTLLQPYFPPDSSINEHQFTEHICEALKPCERVRPLFSFLL